MTPRRHETAEAHQACGPVAVSTAHTDSFVGAAAASSQGSRAGSPVGEKRQEIEDADRTVEVDVGGMARVGPPRGEKRQESR